MRDNRNGKTFYKMFWIEHIENNNLRKTVKHGLIFYLAIAFIIVPSGLCSQQHLEIKYDVPIIQLSDFNKQHTSSEILAYEFRNELDALAHAYAESMRARYEPPFHDAVMLAARTYDVDPSLIHAIIRVESNYNPSAVSHRGAQGLMQLMPRTAKALGVADSFDPAMNIDGGVRYFKRLLDRFSGDVSLALAAYNAGSRYVRKYGGIPPFKETRKYVRKVQHFRKKIQGDTAALELALSAV